MEEFVSIYKWQGKLERADECAMIIDLLHN